MAPYDLSEEFIASVRALLPELPDARRQRYEQAYALPPTDARLLSADIDLAEFFDAVM